MKDAIRKIVTEQLERIEKESARGGLPSAVLKKVEIITSIVNGLGENEDLSSKIEARKMSDKELIQIALQFTKSGGG